MTDAQAHDAPPAAARGFRFDFWMTVGTAFFVTATACSAYAALRFDPGSAPGLVLLVGIATMALLGVFALARREQAPKELASLADWIDALIEPAAIASADGRILAANTAWGEIGGSPWALPRGADASALYVAFAEARKGQAGRALVALGQGKVELMLTPCGPDRFLVRPAPEEVLAPEVSAARPVAAARAPDPRSAAAAAGAPFGSAVIASGDLFDAPLTETNAALPVVLGPKARPGARLSDLIEAAGLDEIRQRAAQGAGGPFELRTLQSPPRTLHLYVAPEGEGARVWLFDISDQKAMQVELFQAQKMQAIGQLAGGVAHDFNNLLTAIVMELDLLQQRHPVGDPSYEGLNQIRQTSLRAADLVKKLLAFSRKQTVQRERLDLGERISELEVLLRRLLREDVSLVTDYGRDLPAVLADRSQLETAVMNLAVNARDAMKDMPGERRPTLFITTQRLSADQARAQGWSGAPAAGEVAVVEVADNGPGIPDHLLQKIFEPFFTTKPVGEGTGMGLATVYGIVEQAGGHLTVHNRPEGGAAFRIFLPAAAPETAAAPVEAKPRTSAPRDLSGAGRILFVEDEAAVRGIAAKLLRARGYEVIEAADGEEALILAEENAGRIDMLISDVIMPGLDGPSLLRKARQYLGDAPVMFISGYAEAEFSDLLEGEANVSFLPKPLDIKTLAERVKRELHQKTDEPSDSAGPDPSDA
ncbi:ATP-binding protein [Brevundimonas sp. 2R-24]|uniref:histidine kinase n=1 Tax=Peiella sedimenti TaxID=3061083 RepID=A0ABT8SN71_9CAUL|nr:ATP-binding protein [Caulobacteraceae bacterium XZ-24]